MTKGVRSSEFYLTVATVICTLLSQFVGVEIDPAALSAIIGSVMAYVVSRGLAKTDNR